MKKFFLAGTALAILSFGPMSQANAAPPPPLFNWTGCYVGVHAGAGLMHDSWAASSGADHSGNGAVLGGQAGCNYQTGMFVTGIEGEGFWSSLNTKYAYTYGDNEGGGYSYSTKNKYDFSVAGRMGVAFDRFFAYGKAGWVWGQFGISGSGIACCSGHAFSNDGNQMLNGLLLGVGLEYALTNRWTVKGEYNYLNYGNSAVSISYCGGNQSLPCSRYTDTVGAEKHIFKLGANYYFTPGH